MVLLQSKTYLLEVVQAKRPVPGFAGPLDRRQQEGDERGGDCDHNQSLDQGKRGLGRRGCA
jgi:hypothetical protein